MHRIFQHFIDLLATANDAADFSEALSKTATALELTCFAYLSLPSRIEGAPRLISSYPERWASHYLQSRYERIDPVIAQALRTGLTRSACPPKARVKPVLVEAGAERGLEYKDLRNGLSSLHSRKNFA
ncbi:autoinducer binding domain-containing protein [Bradyrhizobium tunisiense]|uniref:autoinducer binding domain-containing protein n=1 Tax=Bradyrhizobium tunisiense TaxID=3278709 RepID=UPI0035DF2206